MRKAINRYFIGGLIVSLPLIVTLFFIFKGVELATKFLKIILPLEFIIKYFLGKMPENSISLETLLSFIVFFAAFLLIIFLIILVGIFAKSFISVEAVKYFEDLFLRIPLAKPIYTTVKQISNVVFSENIKSYKKVVMIEYPRKGIYSIGFLTSENVGIYFKQIEEDYINVFIPTSPNPTSGMFIMCKSSEVIFLDIKIEDAIKMVISGGAITPKRERENK